MKILLLNYKNKSQVNSPFFYFGNSFKRVLNIKKKTNHIYITYKGELSQIAKKEERFFLKWIEKKRKSNKDSIYWWMNQLAGRNNQSSNLFLYICQFLYIKSYLKKKKVSNICIVCDNYYLQSFLYKNLQKNYNCTNSINLLNFLTERVNFKIRKIFNYIKGLTKIIIQIIFSILTKPKNIKLPEKDVLLFHHSINSNLKKIDKKNLCNYYLDLPYLIKKKKGIKVISLFWTLSGYLKLSFFRSMREHNSFVPEDWLKSVDYLKIFFDMRKINATLKKKVNYRKNLNLKFLIDLESVEQDNINALRFLMYPTALKNWTKKIKKLIIFDQYQNNIFEHSLRLATKSLQIETKTIGYHHSLVSSGLLVYKGLKNEWRSKTKPDQILTIGKLGKKLLIKGGTPKNKIIETFSLRQVDYKKKQNIKKNKNILLILPLKKELALEICEKIKHINEKLIKLNFRIIVKPHPLLEKKDLLKYLDWKNIPNNWFWENKDLKSCLNKCYLVLTSSSAAIYDAIVRGNIPIIMQSDFTTMNNYLDFFGFKSQSENDLPIILEKLIKKNNLPYHFTIKKIRANLIKGINSRSNFLENKMINCIV